jgi:AraC-like DNA-binding protein/quercetin dioxygenase-like cupin family protein
LIEIRKDMTFHEHVRASFEALTLDGTSTFRFIQIDREDGFDGHWHYHPEYELKWVREGVGQRMVGDHVESFGKDDFVLVGSNLPHCWRTAPEFNGSSQASLLQFPPDCLGTNPETKKIHDLLDQSRLGLRFDLSEKRNKERMGQAFEQLETTEQGSCSSYTSWIELLGLLTEVPKQTLASQGYNLKEPVDDRLARVIDYVFEKVETQITPSLFDESSELVSMTPAAFSRFFKRHTGRTFSRFVNEAKIARACRCLVDSEETVLAISLECGFGSLSHFNRIFMDCKGCSPGRWRSQFKAA